MRHEHVTAVRLALLLLALALATSCGEGQEVQAESSPSWSPDGSKIAFAAGSDIYVMGVDGDGRANLTNSPDDDFSPTWSPSGDKIAFLSRGQAGSDVHIVQPDGGGRANLTNVPAAYTDLAWSPDGANIAFASDRADRNLPPDTLFAAPEWQLYVIDAGGSGETRLTFDGAINLSPTWSPDGTRIAFHSDRDGTTEIYVVNSDGTDLGRLTDNEWPDLHPAWSPDGRHIAFVSSRPKTEFLSDTTTGWDLYLMNADGTDQFALTNVPNVNFGRPSWSPDGGYLVFDGRYASALQTTAGFGRKGINEIYAMHMQGQYEFSRLTDNKTNDEDLHLGPVWSPDGKSIAFLSRSRVRVSRVINSEAEVCPATLQKVCM